MTPKRFPVSLRRAPDQSEVRATQALQQDFAGRGFDTPRGKDEEISIAVVDAIDAIQRKRHTRRASAFGRLETRSTTG